MEEVIVTDVRYKATDGTMHNSKVECIQYEADLKRVTYWMVRHSPDLTEGRGTTRTTGLKAFTPYGASDARMWVDDYCYRTFGRPVAFIQGVSPCPSWVVAEIDQARYEHQAQSANASQYQQANVEVLRIGRTEQGLQSST